MGVEREFTLLVKQHENIRVRLPKYFQPSHFPRRLSMDKVNYNYCRRIIVTLNLMSDRDTSISILRPNTSLVDWWSSEAKYINWTCKETAFLKLPTGIFNKTIINLTKQPILFYEYLDWFK